MSRLNGIPRTDNRPRCGKCFELKKPNLLFGTLELRGFRFNKACQKCRLIIIRQRDKK